MRQRCRYELFLLSPLQSSISLEVERRIFSTSTQREIEKNRGEGGDCMEDCVVIFSAFCQAAELALASLKSMLGQITKRPSSPRLVPSNVSIN